MWHAEEVLIEERKQWRGSSYQLLGGFEMWSCRNGLNANSEPHRRRGSIQVKNNRTETVAVGTLGEHLLASLPPSSEFAPGRKQDGHSERALLEPGSQWAAFKVGRIEWESYVRQWKKYHLGSWGMAVHRRNDDLRVLPLAQSQGWQEPVTRWVDWPQELECTLRLGFPVLCQWGLWRSVGTAWHARGRLGRAWTPNFLRDSSQKTPTSWGN